MVNNISLFCYLLIVFMSCHSCIANEHELVFDPYISAIPDSISTSEQLSIKKTIKEIALNNITVNRDRYVCHFDRRDFIGMGISGKYCRWLKRQIKDQNRNYRKSLRQNPELRSTVPLEVIFESAKKQYSEHPEMSSETEIIMTDIFQYGTQVNCPEDNIRNLFRNWIDFGAGDANLKFLSYEYEGVVDNTVDFRMPGADLRDVPFPPGLVLPDGDLSHLHQRRKLLKVPALHLAEVLLVELVVQGHLGEVAAGSGEMVQGGVALLLRDRGILHDVKRDPAVPDLDEVVPLLDELLALGDDVELDEDRVGEVRAVGQRDHLQRIPAGELPVPSDRLESVQEGAAFRPDRLLMLLSDELVVDQVLYIGRVEAPDVGDGGQRQDVADRLD